MQVLANYRFYPIPDSVKLYISGGLGPYFQSISLNLGINAKAGEGDDKPNEEIQQAESVSSLDKVLNHIAYKLKVGIDYEIIQRIVGTIGVAVGGQLLGLKELEIPNVTLEAGIRYDF